MAAGWGSRIKKARGEMLQPVFAAQLGVGTTMLSEYEREVTQPRIGLLDTIHQLTGATPDEIVLGVKPGLVVDFDILQAAIESVEAEVPDIDAASKAKLIIVLYKDRIKVKHNKNENEAVSHVRRRK
jgi:transcriptional regulator with XRE-family HTH domain